MNDDDFFIGWLPTPKRFVSFLTPGVGIVVISAFITAVILVTYQKQPGTGQWEVGQVITLRGLVGTDPYPMLWVRGENHSEPLQTFMLVDDGKFGALPRVSRIVGDATKRVPVEVRGTILHRDDRWMLALEAGESSLRILDGIDSETLLSGLLDSPKVGTESLTLRGEIIDPKCYLGAMKPGGGKTHKACAMRCIAGGIPPMLVTRDPELRETYYLLVDENGKIANDIIYPFVGDQVELSGRVELRNGMRKFFVFGNSVKRL